MTAGLSKTRLSRKRHYGIVMAFAIVCGVVLVGTQSYFRSSPNDASEPVTGVTEDTKPAVVMTNEFDRSLPTRLVIPKLSLDTTFVSPLGLLPDQTIAVPDSFTQVGWYSGGVSPGEVGSSVILGHVDSKTGPAIFYSLGQLAIGDAIEITREDGKMVTYIVTKLERHPQSNFPTMAVYGQTDTPTLRLVTCSGTYNRGKQQYSHNLIVFAELAQ